MKKIIFAVFLLITLPAVGIAQKHAPRPYVKQVIHGIYPEGSARLLRYSDIEGLTSWDLKIMRNEIFARHGYIFKTRELADYFNQTSWYVPRYKNVYNVLSLTERKNIDFIKSYE